MVKDNVINLLGGEAPKAEGPETLPLWEVDLGPDHSVETVFGEFKMTPISAAFYDFNDKINSFFMLERIVSIVKVGEVTQAEALELLDD